MREYAIIPARAGSKSITNKNLCKVGNMGLAEHAIEQAKKWNFDKVFLSTDINVLRQDYATDKSIIIRNRPEKLCTDTSMMEDVVLDIIKSYDLENESRVWLLQPTSPFRDQYDFEFIERLMEENEARSLISVENVGDDHPNRMYSMRHSELVPMQYTNFKNKQDLPSLFLRNGMYYVFNSGEFKINKRFYQKRCVGFVQDETRSVNVDSKLDLLTAQAVAWNEKL